MLFRLRSPHIIEGTQRNAGTIVGPYGSEAPVILNGPPTPDMEGVDNEGIAEVNRIYNLLHGTDAPWHSQGVIITVERPYHAEHPDNAEYNEEEQNRLNAELAERNKRYHGAGGTAPLETLPHVGAGGTAVRPMTAETPQDQATPTTRPLAQQLPDAQPSAAATPPRPTPRGRATPSTEDEE